MTYDGRDFRNSTPPRIMGSETEYNISSVLTDIDLRSHTQGIFYCEDTPEQGDELWLDNGARLYSEANYLTEYATPEVTSARSLLIHERAGERIVQEVADSVAKYLDTPNASTYKRSGYNLPGKEALTAGHHENYLTSLPEVIDVDAKMSHPLHRALQSYLSTRGVWAGSGLVREDSYELTQKMTTISFRYNAKSTLENQKPGYHINSEYDDLGRLEIRLGDGNMSDWAITHKYAFTSLVLRMIEHGDFPNSLLIPEGSGDLALQSTSKLQTIPTTNKKLHAARHQRYIAEAAFEFASQHPDIPEEELHAAEEIIIACYQIEELDSTLTDVSAIADRIDWAAKLAYLQNNGIEAGSRRSMQAIYHDLQWENIAADGIARKWYGKYGDSSVTESEIQQAKVMSPTTRAMARTALLADLEDDPLEIRWDSITTDEGVYVRMTDPYTTSYDPVSKRQS